MAKTSLMCLPGWVWWGIPSLYASLGMVGVYTTLYMSPYTPFVGRTGLLAADTVSATSGACTSLMCEMCTFSLPVTGERPLF